MLKSMVGERDSMTNGQPGQEVVDRKKDDALTDTAEISSTDAEMRESGESVHLLYNTLQQLAEQEGDSISCDAGGLAGEWEEGKGNREMAERLDREWKELASQVEDIQEFRQVPKEAVKLAAEKGISLFDAFLRFRFEEERRRKKEQERGRRAAGESAGSLRDGGPAPEPEGEEFVRSFRQSVR